MNGGETMGIISIGVTLLLGVLVFITNRKANKTNEKKLTIEEQLAEESKIDSIAERRLGEIRRLDELVRSLREDVDKLLGTVAELQKRDKQKQETIDTQAIDLERTTDALADLRGLFVAFVERVERAWADGHTMPTLTTAEQELLEMTLPHIHTPKKRREQ